MSGAYSNARRTNDAHVNARLVCCLSLSSFLNVAICRSRAALVLAIFCRRRLSRCSRDYCLRISAVLIRWAAFLAAICSSDSWDLLTRIRSLSLLHTLWRLDFLRGILLKLFTCFEVVWRLIDKKSYLLVVCYYFTGKNDNIQTTLHIYNSTHFIHERLEHHSYVVNEYGVKRTTMK